MLLCVCETLGVSCSKQASARQASSPHHPAIGMQKHILGSLVRTLRHAGFVPDHEVRSAMPGRTCSGDVRLVQRCHRVLAQIPLNSACSAAAKCSAHGGRDAATVFVLLHIANVPTLCLVQCSIASGSRGWVVRRASAQAAAQGQQLIAWCRASGAHVHPGISVQVLHDKGFALVAGEVCTLRDLLAVLRTPKS